MRLRLAVKRQPLIECWSCNVVFYRINSNMGGITYIGNNLLFKKVVTLKFNIYVILATALHRIFYFNIYAGATL